MQEFKKEKKWNKEWVEGELIWKVNLKITQIIMLLVTNFLKLANFWFL